MSEVAEQLKERTMKFALDVCELIKLLPHAEPGPTVRRQLAKAATSVAADESQGWLEFIEAAKLIVSKELTRLVGESGELAAIFSASVGTARYKERNSY